MSRNLKKDNLIKLSKVEVNGFKYDLQNYMYNPSYEHDYPQLYKVIEDNDTHKTAIKVSYFKRYDKSSYYKKSVIKYPKNKEWAIVETLEETELEVNTNFSKKKLENFAINS